MKLCLLQVLFKEVDEMPVDEMTRRQKNGRYGCLRNVQREQLGKAL
jgi:hypothetical protein